MRYENPLYMAELAAMADLIAAGRLQLGVSRGSPESVIRGFESFGYYSAEGENESDMARRHLDIFLKAIEGEGMAPSARVAGKYAPVQPQSPGLRDRIWWGAGTDSTAVWTAQKGLNLMSSTLMLEDKGISLRPAAGAADSPLPLRVGESGQFGCSACFGVPLGAAHYRRDFGTLLRSPRRGGLAGLHRHY